MVWIVMDAMKGEGDANFGVSIHLSFSHSIIFCVRKEGVVFGS